MELENPNTLVIGPWHLHERIGSGGNAEVWRAENSAGDSVALKVLRQRRVESEPYQRFRDEIAILRKLNNPPGLLPLIDAHLPTKPSRIDPAWLAMPVAIPIRNFLGAAPSLRDVVDAIAAIASTLASLAENHSVFHRDIKPENLYYFAGSSCIGDFGLVDYPAKQSRTLEGRWIGPIYYLAPELLLTPDTAASGPTDVYALAKTLWVLATGQNYPLPGFLSRHIPQLCLSSYVSDERAGLLDALLERATQHDPNDRPSMFECAQELRAWLAYPYPAGTALSLGELRERVKPAFENRLRAKVLQDEVFEHLNDLRRMFLEKLKVHGKSIEDLTGVPSDAGINLAVARPDEFERLHELGRWSSGIPIVAWRCPCSGSNYDDILAAGVAVLSAQPPEITICGAYWLTTNKKERRTIWHELHHVRYGTAAEEAAIASILRGLSAELPSAAREFAKIVSSAEKMQ